MCFRRFIHARILYDALAMSALLLAAGCGQNPEAVALAEASVDAPTTLTDGGTTWTRTDISTADQECLAMFFQKNQQLVGSPDMDGQPVLYTSGKSDRRFYWVSATADGSRWTCVHFEKGRFRTSDGTGSPF